MLGLAGRTLRSLLGGWVRALAVIALGWGCSDSSVSGTSGTPGAGGACVDTTTVDGFYCCCGKASCSRIPCPKPGEVGGRIGVESGGQTGAGGTAASGGATAGSGGSQGNGGAQTCAACLNETGPWACQESYRGQCSDLGCHYLPTGEYYCLCGSSKECPPGLICTDSGECVAPCDQASDGGACWPGTVCNPLKRYCTECATNADCAGVLADPFCSPDGHCVQCLTDADCGGILAGSRCLQNTCGCSTGADCANSGTRTQCRSYPLPHTCVECDTDTDCLDPKRPRCDRAICRPACRTDGDCPASEPICIGQRDCIECYDTIGLPCRDPAKPQCSWYLQCVPSDAPYL